MLLADCTNVCGTTTSEKATKIKVYKAVVLTTLLYSAESWAMYRRHIQLLDHFHQRCLRILLKIHGVGVCHQCRGARAGGDHQHRVNVAQSAASLGGACLQNGGPSPAQDHPVRRTVSWSSRQRGAKEEVQRLSEKDSVPVTSIIASGEPLPPTETLGETGSIRLLTPSKMTAGLASRKRGEGGRTEKRRRQH